MKRREIITLLSGAAMNEWVNKGAHADFL